MTSPEADVTAPADRIRWVTVLSIIALVAVVDQASKRWILDNLEPGSCDLPDRCIDLVGSLRLNLIFNTGASFGRFPTLGPIIGVASLVLFVVLSVMAYRAISGAQRIVYSLIAGGALGNALDRAFRADDGFMSGAVIDFIDVQWWPVFNIADSAIVLGVIAAIVLSLRVHDRDSVGGH